MEKNPSLKLSEKQRKEIWAFRQRRKEKKLKLEERERLKEAAKTDPSKINIKDVLDRAVEVAVDELLPSLRKLEEKMEKAADSTWFALSEIERFSDHIKEVHGGKTEECNGGKVVGCLEDYSMEDSKEYIKTLMKSLTELVEEDSKKSKKKKK